MDSKYFRFISTVIWLLVIPLALLLVIFLLISFYVKLTSMEGKVNTSEVETLGRYSRINIESGERSFGYVHMKRKLDSDKFISYHNNDGDHFLISNIDTSQYTCFGSCFCEPSRKSMSFSMRKGLHYIVAAVSSLAAYEIANNFFETECLTQMEDSCTEDSISSEVFVCSDESSPSDLQGEKQLLKNIRDRFDEIEKGVKEGKYTKEEGEQLLQDQMNLLKESKAYQKEIEISRKYEYITYDCFGKCIPFTKSYEDHDTSVNFVVDMAEKYGCEKIELSEQVTGYFPNDEIIEEEVKLDLGSQGVYGLPTEGLTQKKYVQYIFMSEYLDNICQDSSKESVSKDGSEKVPLCIGYKNDVIGNMINDHVDCVVASQQV